MGAKRKVDRRDNPMAKNTYVERRLDRMTNTDFLEAHAQPGDILLVGGGRLIELVLRFLQASLYGGRSSLWSHIAIYGGRQQDGKHVIYTSDLDFVDGKWINGYCETTFCRYNPMHYPNFAILNFSLNEEQRGALFAEIRKVSDKRPRYPLFRVFVAGLYSTFGFRKNIYPDSIEDKVVSCSAFVRRVFLNIGIDLSPGIDVFSTFPEDIFRTASLHRRFLMLRHQRRNGRPNLPPNKI